MNEWTQEELQILANLVEARLHQILPEIRRTDSRAFRGDLEHEHQILETLKSEITEMLIQQMPDPISKEFHFYSDDFSVYEH